ncbi:transglutaminaseTgpA domain-containing protein [Candidatus Pelagibacter sp.]|nr:transglutaminaseTgpA domain-containing protein [Candidatus Pelagibacter sp.]
MSRTKILDLKYLSFSILLLCLVSISENLSLSNKIFWAALVVISLFLFNLKFNYKNILTGLYALGLLYLQFTFDRYIFSEEFFIHCLGVLLIVKYAEINTKNNELSFCLICMIISITSLINGQDILSSVIALFIIILSVVNLYLIQQKEVMDFNFKNVLKYLSFGLSIFPIIIIFYLIFPRAEINFRLFDPSGSSLGIPDTIQLGSFEEFSNSDEKVFTLVNQAFKKEDLYFRVKIFDFMEPDKSWRPTSGLYFYNQFKDSLKIKSLNKTSDTYEIILEPYKRRWIPSLNYSEPISDKINISKDFYNQTFISKKPIDRKQQIKFQKYNIKYELSDEIKNYYTDLPDTISKNLVDWVNINKKNKSNIQFLDHILNTFADGTYFYNLNPEVDVGNNYADFFLKLKEGYCEYYAGTFVLLSRLANIPSRIVSGYYGGDLNTVGDFYEFKQKDTHAWAEVWLEGRGWVRVDPTSAIPPSNVRNSLNDVFSDERIEGGPLFSSKIFKLISYYIGYADFVWTRHLLSYDNNKRISFIEEVFNLKFSKIFIWIFAPIFIFLALKLAFKINKTKIINFLFNFIIWKSRKEKKISNSDTHQQIIEKLKLHTQHKYRSFFNLYESSRYSDQNIELTKIFRTFMSSN